MEIKKPKHYALLKWREEHPEEAAANWRKAQQTPHAMTWRREKANKENGKKNGEAMLKKHGRSYYSEISKKYWAERRAKIAAANQDDTGIERTRHPSLPPEEKE